MANVSYRVGVAWPDATNTGFTKAPGYAGSLTPSDGLTIVSGQTYSFCDFSPNGCQVNGLNNVTFIGCRFRTNGIFNMRMTNSTSMTLSYCSVVPLPATPPVVAWPSAGAGQPVDGVDTGQFPPYMIADTDGPSYSVRLDGVTGSNATIDRCDIWGGAEGIDLGGAIPTCIITNNWIHDARNPIVPDDHTNGVGYLDTGGGRSHVTVVHNTIASLGNTNCIGFQGPVTSPYSYIIVRNNYLSGFGICVNMCHGDTGSNNLEFSGNTLATDVRWAFRPFRGDDLFTAANPTNRWFGNRLRVMTGTTPGAASNFVFTSADNGKFLFPDNTISTTDYVP